MHKLKIFEVTKKTSIPVQQPTGKSFLKLKKGNIIAIEVVK
jgi:hypothetical protein